MAEKPRKRLRTMSSPAAEMAAAIMTFMPNASANLCSLIEIRTASGIDAYLS